MVNKNVFNLIGQKKKHLFLIISLMIITLLLSAIFTYLVSYTINYLITDNYDPFKIFITNIEYLKYLFLIAILVLITSFKFILNIYITKLKSNISLYIKTTLRDKLYKKITDLGIDLLDNISIASLEQSTIEGLEQLDLYFTVFLPQFFYSLFAPLILFSFSVVINYKVALVLLGCIPLIPMTIMLFARKAKHTVNKYLDKYHHLGDVFLDGVYGINELKLNLADQMYYEKLKNSSSDFRKTTMKVLSIQLFSLSLMDLIAFGAAGIGIILSLIIKSPIAKLNTTHYVLFLILISAEFFIPLRALGAAFHISLNGVSASKKILNIFKLEPIKWSDKDITNYEYHFNNVSFKYGDKEILNNINLAIKKNAITSIAGNSGSGKSTIIKLLLGQIKPTNGEIIIDQNNLYDLNKINYYKNIALISNDSYLFNDTIKNNFLLYNPNLTDAEIIKALNKVNLASLVNDKGINYLINDVRSNLSGGERQRIYLAIMLALNKELYIFDEATSNIDKDSEEIIFNIINDLKKTKTIIVISHWLNNLKNSDQIYYLNNTEINEKGTHQELVNNKLEYAKLYNVQMDMVKVVGTK